MLCGLSPETINDNCCNSIEVKNNYDNLRFCQVNIRSLLKTSSVGSRLEFLERFCKDNDITICALTETHLDSKIDDDVLNMDHFNVHRRDRNRFGGGVAIYVRDDVDAFVFNDMFIDDFETIWLKLLVNNKEIIFGVCYRPPGQNTEQISFFF